MIKFDTKRLREVCQMREGDFKQYGEVTMTKDGPYIHIDRGSNVLGIAHLDTVGNHPKVRFFQSNKKGPGVQCQQLDDRLGAYVLLDILPQVGVDCDVLLTIGEESGRSTGAHFDPPKDYNWMFQFDRGGTDVVMYEYEDDELLQKVIDAGFRAGLGSFSDICMMEFMGIKALNFGVGYEMEHTNHCYAYLKDTVYMVELFKAFYHEYKNELMEHEKVDKYYEGYGIYDYGTGAYEHQSWYRGSNYHPRLSEHCVWCGYWFEPHDMCKGDDECCVMCQKNIYDDPYSEGWTEGQYRTLYRGTGPYRGQYEQDGD